MSSTPVVVVTNPQGLVEPLPIQALAKKKKVFKRFIYTKDNVAKILEYSREGRSNQWIARQFDTTAYYITKVFTDRFRNEHQEYFTHILPGQVPSV